ncbi:hypothetical protein BDV38DRAFT_280260 [Aspergillus pseudotamarii]|uniref:Uncharacterized protein n=1 Tax=Aspergillus pseudotamarii TaxID=132259 RepID=A0A5N6T1U6_ASPPS|nr:uncharacterized protein BDV38DRAFT_280260 [Aspergillus pseudotamarii]KAE8140264.1 hypothetical protein BDV38DRAFT_280260 [Aspergillus pseudotamarii]
MQEALVDFLHNNTPLLILRMFHTSYCEAQRYRITKRFRYWKVAFIAHLASLWECSASLYSESFDADIALRGNMDSVFYAKSQSRENILLVERYADSETDNLYAQPERSFDYRDSLSTVTVKTRIIFGERDWIVHWGSRG